jgi:hypothetical protein
MESINNKEVEIDIKEKEITEISLKEKEKKENQTIIEIQKKKGG